jgi:hypothetical protein
MAKLAKPAPCIIFICSQAKWYKRSMDQAQERIEIR